MDRAAALGREMPSIAREHIGRGPGGHDLADEQIVGLLVVRLGQHLAFQPAQAARDQRRADLAGGEGGQAAGLELVLVAAGIRADLQRGPRLLARRNAQREFAGSVDQRARMGVLVHHHQHAGGVEVQRHGPGRRHDVAPAAVGAGDQHRGAVVQQQVGTDSSTGWISGAGDTLDSLGTPAARDAPAPRTCRSCWRGFRECPGSRPSARRSCRFPGGRCPPRPGRGLRACPSTGCGS